ncbi:hypothetical protein ITP53_01045 [Nonomuraea sp. K274]|uniref:WD40 repeat domain-containing protein n=1 Tax=Nonomuraea cypriaca TaxID=1187855 RepID=A0A931EVN6_9ACTN|nr:hypothetical protein [Nonomuraea cypriaca]MBF8184355.1 hypothetical protein [Nonomuraea cypriaca]
MRLWSQARNCAAPVTPDGAQLIAGCADGTITMWTSAARMARRTPPGELDRAGLRELVPAGQDDGDGWSAMIAALARRQRGRDR